MAHWSVVLPVHNGEKYLRAALDSTLRWLPRDAELRVLDDGSTDSTAAIIDQYAVRDHRVVPMAHARPLGVARSLNDLVQAGDSALVARMDADDLCLPSRWLLGARALESADFAFTSVVVIDSAGRPKTVDQPGHFSAAAVPYHLVLGCGLVHPTAMFRRSSFDALGGYAQTKAEDYDLWMRAVNAGHKIVRTALPGLAYRRHETQVTSAAPWVADGVTTTLWESYRVLASRIAGGDEEQLARAFAGVLHRATVGPSEFDAIRAVTERLRMKSRVELGAADRVVLDWRIRRLRRRLDSQVARG